MKDSFKTLDFGDIVIISWGLLGLLINMASLLKGAFSFFSFTFVICYQ
jgi:hypothetical protein